MIKIGDWICARDSYREITGYVVDIILGILYVHTPNGKRLRVPHHCAKRLDDQLSKDDLRVLIDLALDLGDEQWFRSLTNQLAGELVNG
ncbi:IDEAL domain-containing protein [Bacillus sonorensis]|uniref:IDEAL domain-containing protein n=1 Tax=Bacillus sonorensis L12 TaxID=1274524 RepID=M5P7G8_9BACI|nr:IDEAL domain-containing protein [Bacillus sonorensis]EME75378.1 hypothetical protein BSONL12_06058 [Bacillus sonorensis L12]MCZ0075002.1 IDEAL domain-containing protein [Bacillus sonorensis]MCZ0094110.1 IDEAL domain-containing protein [Bacillus sonorensis]MDR4956567.1 IDEAL domain-containing protein [Bacillus sonorensis]PAD57618.1 IDEAL domain-containing protein [Bacillus sonorensis]